MFIPIFYALLGPTQVLRSHSDTPFFVSSDSLLRHSPPSCVTVKEVVSMLELSLLGFSGWALLI